MITLKYPSFPHPRWFVQRGELHSAIVQDDGTVAAWDRLDHVIEGVMPKAGTELLIFAGDHHLIAKTREEHEAELAALAAHRKTREAEQFARDQEQRRQLEREANAVNASLHIPVAWTSGYKAVLSGLQEHSFSEGFNSRTVMHVLLLEDLRDGRFVRSKGAFLCTAASGSDGKRWVSPSAISIGADDSYVPQVTCKQCLKATKRWASARRWEHPTKCL